MRHSCSSIVLCTLLTCLATLPSEAATSGKFFGPRDYQLGTNPIQPYVADLNQDGIPDVVLATDSGIAILLGAGNGSFGTPRYVSGNLTTSVALADFNGDGKLDIVATVVTNGTQLIFLAGIGNGTFQPAKLLRNPCVDCALAAADFNRDGRMDLAVEDVSEFYLLLGNGDGTFRTQPSTVSLSYGANVTTGDINGDGIPDAVVVDTGASAAVVLIGRGDGTFTESHYPSSNSFQAVLADVNKDGRPDLITQDRNNDLISVFLNVGGGSFGSPTTFNAGCTPSSGCTFEGIAAGDFNGDGKLDIATPGSFLLGNGDGTFQAPARFLAGNFPITLAGADLNRDGYSDLIVANSGATNISVLLGSAKSLVEAPEIAAGSNSVAIASGDFNGDGRVDLAVASLGQHAVYLLAGDGQGGFTQIGQLANNSPGAVLSGDFNRDGKLDLAVSSQTTGTTIFLGNGDGTFQQGATYLSLYGDCTNHAIGTTPSPCFAIADVNGDGIPDLIGANWIAPTYSVYLGKGDGTFTAGQTASLPGNPTGLAVADLDHDGNPDLAFSLSFSGAVVYKGAGDGTFSSPVTISGVGSTANGIAIGDVTGDGNPDLVIAGGGGSGFLSLNVFVVPGNGNLTFGATLNLVADSNPLGIVIADFNLDGHLDIASTNYVADNVSVFLGNGAGGFTTSPAYITGELPCGLIAADVNGDGRPDLLAVSKGSSAVTLLLHLPH